MYKREGVVMLDQAGDIVIRNRSGHSIAIVDVRSPKTISRPVVEELYQQLLDYSDQVSAFYLLVTPMTGYLWKTADQSRLNTLPTAEFQMQNIIKRYLPTLGSQEAVGSVQLQFLVFQWLNELAAGLYDISQEPERTLAASGFIDAIQRSLALFSGAA